MKGNARTKYRIPGNTKMKVIARGGQGLGQPTKVTKTFVTTWNDVLDRWLDEYHRKHYEEQLIEKGLTGEVIGQNKSVTVMWNLPEGYYPVEITTSKKIADETKNQARREGYDSVMVKKAGQYYVIAFSEEDYRKLNW